MDKSFTALVKLRLVPSTHIKWLTTKQNSSSRGSDVLFWPAWTSARTLYT